MDDVRLTGLIEMSGAASINHFSKTIYTRQDYSFRTQSGLVRTNHNYYQSKLGISTDRRMSNASEELAIQLLSSANGGDAIISEYFSDLLANNGVYLWQWTDTALRVPDKWHDGRRPELQVKGSETVFGSSNIN